MVDVSEKNDTLRSATASGTIQVSLDAYESVKNQTNKKGPVLQTAVVAAISATKQTSTLIPMCHPLMLTGVNVEIDEIDSLPGFRVNVTAKLRGQTGVEMEALTGVSVGLLTIYDMLKAIDKTMVISDIELLRKEGGKSGLYQKGEGR